MDHDKRAKDLGELIAERMQEEHPNLVRDMGELVNHTLKKYDKPWYTRLYNKIHGFFM